MTSQQHSIEIPLSNGANISIPYVIKLRKNRDDPWESENLAEQVQSWAANEHTMVYRILQETSNTSGCVVSVEMWDPYTCQGCCFPDITLALSPSKEVFWSRSTPQVPSDFWTKKQPAGTDSSTKEGILRDMFDIIFQAKAIQTVEITKLEDDEATEILYEKLVNNSMVTRIEFLNGAFSNPNNVSSRARRPMELCCRLLANSCSLKECMVENIGKLPTDLVNQLFLSMRANFSLEILDLRCSRYLESWYKSSPNTESRDNPNNLIDIEPLVSALLNPDGLSSLQTLDLGGNAHKCSAPICSLAKELPNLGLRRLSLRGCSLTEDSLVAIARGLEGNVNLQELDLSHNVLTRTALDEITQSLQRNRFLRTLRIEHCGIDLDLVEGVMTKRLPKMKHLQHLHMDGNEFTWEPLTENGEESIGAKLLVDALEENTSITILDMGESGKLRPFGMPCCTSPPYFTVLESENQERLGDLLSRNEQIQEEYLRTRAQQAVVTISKLLLSKMVPEN